MKVNVAEFLRESGIDEPFYPGKRLVKQCRQAGDFKAIALYSTGAILQGSVSRSKQV